MKVQINCKCLKGSTDSQLLLHVFDELHEMEVDELLAAPVISATLSTAHSKSLTQNAYTWKLCTLIAAKLRCDKTDVYRHAIKERGVCDYLSLCNEEAANSFSERWSTQGEGWFTERIGTCDIIAYYGTSVYNSEEISAVISCLEQDAEAIGISTPNAAGC